MTQSTPHAIILLAGIGSRLRPLTDTTHKALLTIGEKTILERQVQQLITNQVKNFHLVLGYRANDIKTFIEKRFGNQIRNNNIKFFFYENKNYAETNTGYSLLMVLHSLKEKFLLLDGDVLLDKQLIEPLCNAREEKNILLCDTHHERLDAEAVKCALNDKAEITTIGKKISLEHAVGESIGVGLFQQDWAQALEKHLDQLMQDQKNWQWYYEDAMQDLISLQKAPSPLKIASTKELPWVEIDDATDLLRARQLFSLK